ncbi:MAG TPA: hypothetical protein VFV50_15270 [Bdellovibrionales bacterium]|nr:hypothetical protein [Bdellovibrionales bacterium]
MNFTPASPVSIGAFVLILIFVIGFYSAGTFIASRRLGGPALKRALLVLAGILAWNALLAIPVVTGWISAAVMPRLMLFFLAANLAAVIFAFSAPGVWLSRGLPIWALVAFQGFRLPLELILHSWGEQGTIPMSMTWSGSNFDVITGIASLALAPFAVRSAAAAWMANLIGFALLLNVGRVAVLSSPLPFAWGVEPPLQLVLYLPYAWIGPVCVAGALAGHVILTRALLSKGVH